MKEILKVIPPSLKSEFISKSKVNIENKKYIKLAMKPGILKKFMSIKCTDNNIPTELNKIIKKNIKKNIKQNSRSGELFKLQPSSIQNDMYFLLKIY